MSCVLTQKNQDLWVLFLYNFIDKNIYFYYNIIREVENMNTKVCQWGNSAGIRIPKKAIIASRFDYNDEVEVVATDGQIILKKKKEKDYGEIFKPFISTKGWKFDREEANEG